MKYLVVPALAGLLIALMAYVLFIDQIQLNGIAGSLPSTVVVDGRRGACLGDLKASGVWSWWGNIRTPQNCHSEIIAFSEGAAMNIQPEVNAWTDSSGDKVNVSMSARVNVPVNVFVMAGDINGNVQNRLDRAEDDVTRANEIFGGGQSGIMFTLGLNKDVTRGAFRPSLLDAGCTGNVPAFNAVDGDTSKAGVKVFYVEGPSGLQGESCKDNLTAVIIITLSSNNETLAHEIGHAFMLDHSNGVAGMPNDNLMMSPSASPASLTLGQCYRMNVDHDSVANLSGFRNGIERPCPHLGSGAECLTLDFHK